MYTVELCTSGAPVSLTNVRARSASNISISDWAWRKRVPDTTVEGEHYGRARSVPGFTREPVPYRCGASKFTAELDVSVNRPSAGDGLMRGFYIDYGEHELPVSFGIGICEATCSSAFIASLEKGP